MGHKRQERSFETPRKRAAPLAITAQPLRGDDGGMCGAEKTYNDRLSASGEMLRGLGAARWPVAV
jgi:hypothetical protein